MPNLTLEQCREDTVGYLVYRSDKENGTYYQASPLLFEPQWTDESADSFAFNWYKVKVLDTGGYLSEFSEPLLLHFSFKPKLKTVIPVLPPPPPKVELIAPKISIDGSSFIIKEGTAFRTKFTLTGSEPITVTVEARDRAGTPVTGFSVDAASRTVSGANSLARGFYNVTIKAKNSAGESSVTFLLEVQVKEVLTPPKLLARRDGYKFSMSRLSTFTVKLSASGSEPFRWSLEPINARLPVPPAASIDDTGLLTVDGKIPTGNYSFVVKVMNEVGSDQHEIQLEVKPVFGGLGFLKPPSSDLASAKAAFMASLTPPSKPAVPPQPAVTDTAKIHLEQMTCLGFSLTDVNFYSSPLGGASGSALLNIGYEETVPVSIMQPATEKKGDKIVMSAGTVYLKEPFPLKKIGVTLVSLNISPLTNTALVSGYVLSTVANQNLLGDLYALEFSDAKLNNGSIVVKKNLPEIRYKQFTIHDAQELWIRTNVKQTSAKDFISLSGVKVAMKSHLETLNNEGLELSAGVLLTFDLQGRMSGTLYTTTEQFLQLLVPGGAGLRIDAASLTFVDGEILANGALTGKLVLPFERPDTSGPGVPGVYAGGHPKTNEMDALAAGPILSPSLKTALYAGLLKFGKTVQQNGLLILPDDFALQDQCSYVPIEIHNWTGKGFLIQSAPMTPTRVAERSLTMEKQRSQAVVVSPTAVTVDLDREGFVPRESPEGDEVIMTPNETEKPFWVGLVMHGGTVTLPADFVQANGGGTIEFRLAKGEMIYDLNGFNYQTYLYSNNPEGVPADFGKALGGFQNVWVHDCLLDLYANRVNLEINAEVAVDLFLQNRVKVKLYTNQEDNKNGKKGDFLCSVAPTTIENALAEGINLRIDVGWLKEDGMHLSGAMELPAPATPDVEVCSAEPLAFTDMIVPANILRTVRQDNPEGKYAAVELDRPVNIDYQGFTMEVRAFDFEYIASRPVTDKPIWLTLYGATLFSETIPLSADTTDRLIVECPIHWLTDYFKVGDRPFVVHEESHSVLRATFDDCIDVSGVLVPKAAPSGGDGLVEYDTDQLNLTFLKQLEELPVRSVTRFGYDLEQKRSYFAAGLIPDNQGAPINFGGGEIQNFTGMVAYNMTVDRDGLGRFEFPKSAGQIENFINNLQVHKGSQSTFAAGIRGKMVVMGLCDIRDLYFGFEPGPIVVAGGELYLPLDVSAMVGTGDYTYVGAAEISYSHPQRYFSFSMTIEEFNLAVAKVGGSLGFEYSPHLFGVYLGYPETLGGMIGIFHMGVGVGLRIDQDGDSMIQAKMELGLERDVSVSIVYLRGYLYAGADGTYYFDSDRITLVLYLKGGVQGGIKVGGKRYNIIGFYLDAVGKLESAKPYDSWQLGCSAKVSYSLDLWLVSVEGSVQASFNTKIG